MEPVIHEADRSPMRRRGLLRSRALWTGLAVCAAGAAFAGSLHAAGGADALAERLGPLAPFAAVPVLALVSATPFPSEVFVIPVAGIFGFHSGALMTWAAWLGASFIQFFVARSASREAAVERLLGRMPVWLQRLPVSHPLFLICARWFPWGPLLVNSAAGLGRVEVTRYAWCAAVGILPQAVFISAVGNAIL